MTKNISRIKATIKVTLEALRELQGLSGERDEDEGHNAF